MSTTSFSASWQKLINKVSSKEVPDFDIFYQLTYMSAVAAAGISRARLFHMGCSLATALSDFFRRVDLLVQRLGYDYATACQIIGESVPSEKISSLLLRLADALRSGQPEVDFFSEEAQVHSETFEKNYERDLTSLNKWTDAYAAMNVSSALIVIVVLLSTLIYELNNAIVFTLTAGAIGLSGVGAWILRQAAPKQTRLLFSPEGPLIHQRVRLLARFTLPLMPIIASLTYLITRSMAATLTVAGLSLLPIGVLILMAERQVDEKDEAIAAFLRTLGTVASSAGTTLTDALDRVDLTSFPVLLEDLKTLRWRLNAAIEPALCWERFALETGSKLIAETIRIFMDAITLGAEPDTVAGLASDFAQTNTMLRAKRKVIASTFSWLVIVMHGALAILMVMVLTIVEQFTLLISESMTEEVQGALANNPMPLPIFSHPNTGLIHNITVSIIVVLMLINAYAVTQVEGSHPFKICFYLSLLALLSAAGFVVVPPLVHAVMPAG